MLDEKEKLLRSKLFLTEKERILIRKLDDYYYYNGVSEKLQGWINKLVKNERTIVLEDLECIKNNEYLLPVNIVLEIYNHHTDNMKLFYYLNKFQAELSEQDFNAIEDRIVEYWHAESLYNSAKNIKRTNKQKLQDAILKTDDIEYIYMFARDIKGADVKLCQARFIEILKTDASVFTGKNPFEAAYKFLRDVPNADAEEIIDFLSDTEYFNNFHHNGEYIYLTALHYVQNLRNKDLKEKYVNTLCSAEAKSNHPEFIYLFALNIKGANIEELEDSLIATGMLGRKYLLLFAKNVKGANVDKLQKAMANLSVTHETFDFATSIEGAVDVKKQVNIYNRKQAKEIESLLELEEIEK